MSFSDFGLFEVIDSGPDSLRVTADIHSRHFASQVYQAQRDFGAYLASAEDERDLMDRVALVEAELRQAGVEDPQSVLEALAASSADDDTDEDSDSSDDDSDVPDFVDTDENDSKDRDDSKKESAKTAGGYAPDMPTSQQDSQHLQETGFQDPAKVLHQQPEGVPLGGSAQPAVPATDPGHLGNPAFGGGQNPGATGTNPVVPRNVAPSAPGVPGAAGFPDAGLGNRPQQTASTLPFKARISK